MTSKTYVDLQEPVVDAEWLNDVDAVVYEALAAAGVPPTTAAQVVANLALVTLTGAATLTNKIISGGTISLARSILKRVDVTYSASMTFDAEAGNEFDITATNGTAFTINAPTGASDGQRITVTIRNTSGGALGVATWNAVFKMAALTNPATGFSRSVDFRYNSADWVQVGQTGVDVPN